MNKLLVTLAMDEIYPYEKNPRRNDNAVDDVAESIRQAGYIASIIVDENNEILAGHTRYKALQKLGYKEIEVMRVSGLTEEQKKKYRLLDNKVAEKATWDFDLLQWELDDVSFEGYDFGFDVGGEIDFTDDDFISDKEKNPSKAKMATCPECGCEFEI